MAISDLGAYFEQLKTSYSQGGVLSIPTFGLITITNNNSFVSVLRIEGSFSRQDSTSSITPTRYIIQSTFGNDATVWRGQYPAPGSSVFGFSDIGVNSVRLKFPQVATSPTYGLSLKDPSSGAITRFSLTLDGAFLIGSNAEQTEKCVVTFGE